VSVESPADHDRDARLAVLHVGTDADEGQSGRFLLVAEVGTYQLQGDDPAHMFFAECIEGPDPVVA
jgi:hypothetical protein